MIMYSIAQPTPAEVEACLRRARAERSRVIRGFFRRLAGALVRRPLHPVAPAKPA
jgi:hypothetical protein